MISPASIKQHTHRSLRKNRSWSFLLQKNFPKLLGFVNSIQKCDCQSEMSELWSHYILLPMKYGTLLLISGITLSPRDFYFVKVKINLKHLFICTCENGSVIFWKENVNITSGEHIFTCSAYLRTTCFCFKCSLHQDQKSQCDRFHLDQ